MTANEIEPIIQYLIEWYFDNNDKKDWDKKEVCFYCHNNPEEIKIEFEWGCGLNKRGGNVKTSETFRFKEGEKITNLENYVNEAIERILEHEWFDEREKHDDPSIGH